MRNFREAAASLHMSQPPLSRAIQQLEERLSTRLFDRDTRSVRLTEAGEILVPQARQILLLLDQAEASLGSGGKTSSLRLGVTTALEPSRFEASFALLRPSFPALSTYSASSPKLVSMVKSGKLDAALIALPVATGGLHVERIGEEAIVVALKTSHRLARLRRPISLKELAGDPIYGFQRSRQPEFFDYWRRTFIDKGFAPRVVEEPVDHHVLLAGVAAGEASAFLPGSFQALRRTGVVYKRLVEGDAMATGIGLATAADRRDLSERLLAQFQKSWVQAHPRDAGS